MRVGKKVGKMKNLNFGEIKKVHFVGVGGIGVSALARKMLMDGKRVSGSDRIKTEITNELRKIGADIFIGHNAKNLGYLKEKRDELNSMALIYSPAIAEDNVELVEARKMGVLILSYPEALGIISKDYYTIAVSGTDGKTTTVAMLAKVFEKANLDPTVVLGSLFKKRKSNFIAGRGEYFIVEACEYKRSFLNLHPRILVITNINLDHLDYYKDLKDIQSAFRKLVFKLGAEECLICDITQPNIAAVIRGAKCKIVNYSHYFSGGLKLKIPGKHNLENAAACLAVADVVKIDLRIARKILGEFKGIWRRFEYKGKTKEGALVYDDYAHNPNEVRASLKGFREFFSDKKITVIFQPHLYSRTKFFLDDFAKSFNDADEIFIVPIYAAREKADSNINSKMLARKIKKFNKNVFYFEDFEETLTRLEKDGKNQDIIITMGAGDIYKIGEVLVKEGS